MAIIQTKTKTIKKTPKTYPILSEEGDLADALNETARMRAQGKVPKAKDAMKQVDKWNKEGKLGPKKMGGKVVKKAKNGTSLGMKSVKAGYDNNSGVTRADFVSIGKGKAKSGAKVKKAMMGSSMMQAPMMKKGGMIKKCKSGCK